MKILGFIFVLVSCHWAHSMVNYRQALDKKINNYIDDGVFVGGEVGKGFSLLNVRRDYSQKVGVERIVLDLGDHKGEPLLDHISYFNIAMNPDQKTISIDLAQVQRSAIAPDRLKNLFKSSPYVDTAEVVFDPSDLSTNLLLKLKTPVELEVFKLPSSNKASRIVLDLKKRI